MNIFAKIITTSDENIKNEIIAILWLTWKEKFWNYEVYSKSEVDAHIVLIFWNNISSILDYAKENYEIVKIFHIGKALPLDSLDINLWDIMIPNKFINKENEVVFLEYLVEKNYDLKNFWLLLNGICISLENDIKDEEELEEIITNYSAEIFDKESFSIAKNFEKYELLEVWSIIKIIGEDDEYIKNWVSILEIML
jgi:hypothetical protein